MRKLTYVIAMMALLLIGCSQDESVMENKGELVTLNYNVSMGDGVQSRTGEEEPSTTSLKVNKLLCAVYQEELDENNKKIYEWRYTEAVYDNDATDGIQFKFSPIILDEFVYKIVFFACHENEDENTYFIFDDDMTLSTITPNYEIKGFEEKAMKDAFAGTDIITEGNSETNGSVELIRPFSQVNVLTSVNEYYTLKNDLRKEPKTSVLTFSELKDTYNALTGEWSGLKNNYTLISSVRTDVTKTIDKVDYYYLANEYLFASGDNPTCTIQVYDKEIIEEDDQPIYQYNMPNLPLSGNMNTNLYNQNLLTGGGITYTITLIDEFEDNNKQITGNN